VRDGKAARLATSETLDVNLIMASGPTETPAIPLRTKRDADLNTGAECIARSRCTFRLGGMLRLTYVRFVDRHSDGTWPLGANSGIAEPEVAASAGIPGTT
jgi:hypothetical protein